jgi:uncharacterized protein YjbI with pentapeptide repeats
MGKRERHRGILITSLMKFEIKNRFTGELIFSIETETWKLAVEAAIKSKANLSKADLSEADLSEANLSKANLSKANLSKADLSKADLSKADLSKANLSKANLSWANLSKADLSKADLSKADLSKANLSKANLSWANLSKADLSKADLSWANLSKADLSEADLSEANLSKANLSKANLSEADLSKANLSKADLSEANLRAIKHDVWGVLLQARKEVPFLRQALIDGKVNGSTYSGECACLCGTIANAQGEGKAGDDLPYADSSSLAERFFLAIREGDKPENNGAAKIALAWIDEFIELTK